MEVNLEYLIDTTYVQDMLQCRFMDEGLTVVLDNFEGQGCVTITKQDGTSAVAFTPGLIVGPREIAHSGTKIADDDDMYLAARDCLEELKIEYTCSYIPHGEDLNS